LFQVKIGHCEARFPLRSSPAVAEDSWLEEVVEAGEDRDEEISGKLCRRFLGWIEPWIEAKLRLTERLDN
jgi:hypothetical protein